MSNLNYYILIFLGDYIFNPYYSGDVRNGTVGRPKKEVTDEQLQYLRQLGFTWTSISSLLGISRSTLYRRKQLLNDQPITNDDLELTIREILNTTPNAGEVYVLGALKARNIRVQRWKVREQLQFIDPIGRALRKRTAIRRRVYRIKGANYLWYIKYCRISYRHFINTLQAHRF